MQLYIIGVNHTTAPIHIREQIAFHAERLASALRALTATLVAEAVILSTCNRTEVYCLTQHPQPVGDWLAQYHGISASTLMPYTYTLHGKKAIQHIFRVACGLDSMVLGEPQVLGQMKQAVKLANAAGTLGQGLYPFFQYTFEVAKAVRTQTSIGENTVSLATAAVKIARRIFGDLSQQRLLMIGAGDMIEVCTEHFVGQGARDIVVANRSLGRATNLAKKFSARALLLTEMSSQFPQFDIVLTSTASTLPIIGLGLVESALKQRRQRPMLMLDLAVPRDIEPQVTALNDVFLYTVDDLGEVVSRAMENRQQAAFDAEAMVLEHVETWQQRVQLRQTTPTIRALRDLADEARKVELARAQKRLARGDPALEVLEKLSLALTNKLMHPPSNALKNSQGASQQTLIDVLRALYSLDT